MSQVMLMQSKFAFDKVFDLEESQVRTLFEKLPRIELRQTDAVKEIFYTNSKISKTKLNCLFLWLQSLDCYQDTEWSIILGKALNGDFGDLPSGWETQLPELMTHFCASNSQEYFLERIADNDHKLNDSELSALWKIFKSSR